MLASPRAGVGVHNDVLQSIRQACDSDDVAEVTSDFHLWAAEPDDLEAVRPPIVRMKQTADLMASALQLFCEVGDDRGAYPRPRPTLDRTDGSRPLATHVIGPRAAGQGVQGFPTHDRPCGGRADGVQPRHAPP